MYYCRDHCRGRIGARSARHWGHGEDAGENRINTNREDRKGETTFDVVGYRMNGEEADKRLKEWAESKEAEEIYSRIKEICGRAKKGMRKNRKNKSRETVQTRIA